VSIKKEIVLRNNPSTKRKEEILRRTVQWDRKLIYQKSPSGVYIDEAERRFQNQTSERDESKSTE
jgi:hypothetical protein